MSAPTSPLPPCVIHEDEHLLVVNKPPGWNTHSPSPYAGEGIYEWLKHREPRWASLAIIHRLDKETSGVMVFGKTPVANKSLTEQFATRRIKKLYLLTSEGDVPTQELTVRSRIERARAKYVSKPVLKSEDEAITVFRTAMRVGDLAFVEAEPLTGRTHQIRVHAAESGFPIDGDELYGGAPGARLCLSAVSLTLHHPESGQEMTFGSPAAFDGPKAEALRFAIIDLNTTNAFRCVHGAADDSPGIYVDMLGKFMLSQSEGAPPTSETDRAHYHKTLRRDVRQQSSEDSSPKLVSGETAPERFTIRENGVNFELSFNEGYSVGLFLDQRDNRRRLLVNHVGADFGPVFRVGRASSLSHSSLGLGDNSESQSDQGDGQDARPTLLNAFAYTCAFSVCAAKAGAITTSLDLSKKYLDWGRRNFEHNGLDPEKHDFIYGDCFDWMKRLAKKGRAFDLVMLDPPTFSQSKQSGVWRADKDYGKLASLALPLVKTGGVLFASCNAASLKPEKFLEMIEVAVRQAGRKILQQHYVPQPPDFLVSHEEPAYLKTVWLRLSS